MNKLKQIIIEKIKKQGPIPFETYMDIALYYPGLGYYSSPDTVIGRSGDFYTSPHLHKIFGAMMGLQIEEMWRTMRESSDFNVVEMGAGAGYLCKDMLDHLNSRSVDQNVRSKEFFDSLNYIIIEKNPYFIEKQKALLSGFGEKVSWVSSLSELKSFRGCVISNELLDSFPVHIMLAEEMADRIKEIHVSLDGDKLIEITQDVSCSELTNYFKSNSIEIPPGYRTEINLKIRGWLEQVCAVMEEGFILTVDYGYTAEDYYSDERSKGTLLCFHRHQAVGDPYSNIGCQDITAHVNFSSLKKWGDDLGLRTIGYCPQGTYLVALGIDKVISELYENSPDYENEVRKIKGLILPQGLGESHKVMIQYKGAGSPELRGFSMRNQIRTL
ncbi:MAG TPA: hypothetical protein ENH40_04240 [Nitrospirae bacterium]|nr:hypothetical protein [Nitrospirota bacterium]